MIAGIIGTRPTGITDRVRTRGIIPRPIATALRARATLMGLNPLVLGTSDWIALAVLPRGVIAGSALGTGTTGNTVMILHMVVFWAANRIACGVSAGLVVASFPLGPRGTVQTTARLYVLIDTAGNRDTCVRAWDLPWSRWTAQEEEEKDRYALESEGIPGLLMTHRTALSAWLRGRIRFWVVAPGHGLLCCAHRPQIKGECTPSLRSSEPICWPA